jgi:hypothetical protein
LGIGPFFGKRHDVEEIRLEGRHVRRACKNMGKKDNWQENKRMKGKCTWKKMGKKDSW